MLGDAFPQWRSEKFLAVLGWMRAWNAQHAGDPLRFVGVDVGAVRAVAYDAVANHVSRAEPDRLIVLSTDYAGLRPVDVGKHTEWYQSLADKQPIIDQARKAYELVESLPADDGHALALQHARSIVGYYEFHAIDSRTSMDFLEARLAENLIWWHEHTGHKLLYWSGSQGAVGHARSVSFRPAPSRPTRNAGSYLREHFGSAYVSVGNTFDHGSVNLGSTQKRVPAPPNGSADAVLGAAGQQAYLLDLHAEQPEPVWVWLDQPAKWRMVGPGYDPANDAEGNNMSGGSLSEWFDVIVHTQEITPTRSLA